MPSKNSSVSSPRSTTTSLPTDLTPPLALHNLSSVARALLRLCSTSPYPTSFTSAPADLKSHGLVTLSPHPRNPHLTVLTITPAGRSLLTPSTPDPLP